MPRVFLFQPFLPSSPLCTGEFNKRHRGRQQPEALLGLLATYVRVPTYSFNSCLTTGSSSKTLYFFQDFPRLFPFLCLIPIFETRAAFFLPDSGSTGRGREFSTRRRSWIPLESRGRRNLFERFRRLVTFIMKI